MVSGLVLICYQGGQSTNKKSEEHFIAMLPCLRYCNGHKTIITHLSVMPGIQTNCAAFLIIILSHVINFLILAY